MKCEGYYITRNVVIFRSLTVVTVVKSWTCSLAGGDKKL
jgi:hypothetical protein